MLIQPDLVLLSHDDMVQRYRETFIHYDGEVHYVCNIGENKEFYLKNKKRGEFVVNPFNWGLLNIERPKSGWYLYKDSKNREVCQHFRLQTKKQFHRGLSEGNYFIFSPNTNRQGLTSKYDLFELAFKGPDPKKEVFSWEDLCLILHTGKVIFIRLQPQMMATCQADVVRLYYRTQEILAYDVRLDKLYPHDTVTFRDEINESIINFPWTRIIEQNALQPEFIYPEGDALEVGLAGKQASKFDEILLKINKREEANKLPAGLQHLVNMVAEDEMVAHDDHAEQRNWDEGPNEVNLEDE